MRVKNSIINVATGVGNQIIITSLSFVSRTVFITYLGVEYLGISGLFTSILAMFALAEAGIGSSIVYSLYKPVAEKDYKKINLLMRLYKNAYIVIGIVVLLTGLSILPFLDFFVKDTTINNIEFIYLIFLLNTVLPYFYLHKNNFLSVNQKMYIVTAIFTISSIISVCLKIAILYYTKNFILYLAIESLITLVTSIILAIIVNNMYPFLKEKVNGELDRETKAQIVKNVKAIVLQNIGVYLVFGTDNIIISSFISVTAVGIYSNYYMLIEICRNFTNQIFQNVYHSVGNLVAKESISKVFNIYKVLQLLNFWLYSFFSILLLIVLEPFIKNWIGSEFLMDKSVLIILIIVFYERGMRNAISTVKSTAGFFHEDRFSPLCQAVINLSISIILVQYIGILGVFLGTIFSALIVPFWFTPYIVFKNFFKKSLVTYYISYIHYLIIGIFTFFLTYFMTNDIPSHNYIWISLKALACIGIVNLSYIVIFYRSSEFKYFVNIYINIRASMKENHLNKGFRKLNKPSV